MRLQANLLVKNALARVRDSVGDNGSIFPRPKEKLVELLWILLTSGLNAT